MAWSKMVGNLQDPRSVKAQCRRNEDQPFPVTLDSLFSVVVDATPSAASDVVPPIRIGLVTHYDDMGYFNM